MSLARSPLATRIETLLAKVPDPEIPALSVVDLGIVRRIRDTPPEVAITPTYSCCPATAAIKKAIRFALDDAGLHRVGIVIEADPPWTTDWITAEGREKLRAYGIAPPLKAKARWRRGASEEAPTCPRCGSSRTEELSPFGSTPCKALWRCRACAEPFERFKCF